MSNMDVDPSGLSARGIYALGMPQMLFGGLSERWLFKEAGDLHWRMLCEDLGVPSGELVDSEGERLYSSFMRIRVESTQPLTQYGENESIAAKAKLGRFGDKRFFSELTFTGATGEVRVQMVTVFVTRATDNKSLARATPQQLERSRIHCHDVLPPFGRGYQKIKQLAFEATEPVRDPVLELAGASFDWAPRDVDTREYTVNPYHDFNGANLLYFASYPRIHDVCERLLLNERLRRAGRPEDAALVVAPLARDVYYFGNADAGDVLRVKIQRLDLAAAGRLRVWSTLYRQRDEARIADVFTVKAVSDASLAAVIVEG
jgi:probable biosynthetic protein (TIGR04098 family)